MCVGFVAHVGELRNAYGFGGGHVIHHQGNLDMPVKIILHSFKVM